MMLQEGGSPQTEQQMSEMIKENLTLSVKKGNKLLLITKPSPLSTLKSIATYWSLQRQIHID